MLYTCVYVCDSWWICVMSSPVCLAYLLTRWPCPTTSLSLVWSSSSLPTRPMSPQLSPWNQRCVPPIWVKVSEQATATLDVCLLVTLEVATAAWWAVLPGSPALYRDAMWKLVCVSQSLSRTNSSRLSLNIIPGPPFSPHHLHIFAHCLFSYLFLRLSYLLQHLYFDGCRPSVIKTVILLLLLLLKVIYV